MVRICLHTEQMPLALIGLVGMAGVLPESTCAGLEDPRPTVSRSPDEKTLTRLDDIPGEDERHSLQVVAGGHGHRLPVDPAHVTHLAELDLDDELGRLRPPDCQPAQLLEHPGSPLSGVARSARGSLACQKLLPGRRWPTSRSSSRAQVRLPSSRLAPARPAATGWRS